MCAALTARMEESIIDFKCMCYSVISVLCRILLGSLAKFIKYASSSPLLCWISTFRQLPRVDKGEGGRDRETNKDLKKEKVKMTNRERELSK